MESWRAQERQPRIAQLLSSEIPRLGCARCDAFLHVSECDTFSVAPKMKQNAEILLQITPGV